MAEARESDLSDEDLLTIVALMPDYLAVLDREARFLWVNRLDPTLQRSDVIGRSLYEFIRESHVREARGVVERCLETGTGGTYEAPGYGGGDTSTIYQTEVVPLPGDRGGNPRCMLRATDVTERRRMEDALAESEGRFRLLVEGLPGHVTCIDENRIITYVNREPPPESGLTRDDILGRRNELFMVPEDRAHAVAETERVIETGEPCTFECTVPDGNRFRVKAVPLPRKGDRAEVLLVAADITREYRMAKQRERMLAELDHRVKNTLAMVSAVANQTVRCSRSLESFKETFFGRIQSLSRAHEALAKQHWAECDLTAVVAMSTTALAPGVRLAEGSANPLVPVQAITPLSLALHELTTNALKYGGLSGAGGALSLRAEMPGVERLTLRWEERCADPGANEEGLGLRLVRSLIEHELGGQVELEMRPDGRAYRLEIPLSGR